jgi:hypothetical protein
MQQQNSGVVVSDCTRFQVPNMIWMCYFIPCFTFHVGTVLVKGRCSTEGIHRNLYGIHAVVPDSETENPASLFRDTKTGEEFSKDN